MDFFGRFTVGFILGPIIGVAAIVIIGSIVENPWTLLWPAGIVTALFALLLLYLWLTRPRQQTPPQAEPLPPASLSPPQPTPLPGAPPPHPMSAARRAQHEHWRRDYRGWQFRSPRK